MVRNLVADPNLSLNRSQNLKVVVVVDRGQKVKRKGAVVKTHAKEADLVTVRDAMIPDQEDTEVKTMVEVEEDVVVIEKDGVEVETEGEGQEVIAEEVGEEIGEVTEGVEEVEMIDGIEEVVTKAGEEETEEADREAIEIEETEETEDGDISQFKN